VEGWQRHEKGRKGEGGGGGGSDACRDNEGCRGTTIERGRRWSWGAPERRDPAWLSTRLCGCGCVCSEYIHIHEYN
jgi:hypothetical protein